MRRSLGTIAVLVSLTVSGLALAHTAHHAQARRGVPACSRAATAIDLLVTAQEQQDAAGAEGWQSPHSRWVLQQALGNLSVIRGLPLAGTMFIDDASSYAQSPPRGMFARLRAYLNVRADLITLAAACGNPDAAQLIKVTPDWVPPKVVEIIKRRGARHLETAPPLGPQPAPAAPPGAPDALGATPAASTTTAGPPDSACSPVGATGVYYTPVRHTRDLLRCESVAWASGTRVVWRIVGH